MTYDKKRLKYALKTQIYSIMVSIYFLIIEHFSMCAWVFLPVVCSTDWMTVPRRWFPPSSPDTGTSDEETAAVRTSRVILFTISWRADTTLQESVSGQGFNYFFQQVLSNIRTNTHTDQLSCKYLIAVITRLAKVK